MNHQDWRHDFARIERDVLTDVLPFVESTDNVSREREDVGTQV